jgi:peptidoglycan/xylan/chitin deacetylase (PgdA/CDA1 family)
MNVIDFLPHCQTNFSPVMKKMMRTYILVKRHISYFNPLKNVHRLDNVLRGAVFIKGALAISFIFFLLFVVYASMQIQAHNHTLGQLEQAKQENKELQIINEQLRNEIKKIKQKFESKQSYIESATRKVAYLTFDDGPSANTEKVLAILDRYHIKATFFVIGNNSEFGKQMYKRIVYRGHALGLHSYSHNYRQIYASSPAFHKDFVRIKQLVYETTGYAPNIMRFPGGSNNLVSRKYGGRALMPLLIKEITKEGYQYFDWNVDSRDAERTLQPRDVIVRSVLKGSHGKTKVIILMHDSQVKTTTVEALPAIIEGLKKQGFSFDILTNRSFIYHFAITS